MRAVLGQQKALFSTYIAHKTRLMQACVRLARTVLAPSVLWMYHYFALQRREADAPPAYRSVFVCLFVYLPSLGGGRNRSANSASGKSGSLLPAGDSWHAPHFWFNSD